MVAAGRWGAGSVLVSSVNVVGDPFDGVGETPAGAGKIRCFTARKYDTDGGGDLFGVLADYLGHARLGKRTYRAKDLPFADGDFRVITV